MQLSLFDSERLSFDESIDLTVQSLQAYGKQYKHWAIAFSGGKDSSALVTLIAVLLEQKRMPTPESVTVLYADTRQELPPLHFSALRILKILQQRGIQTRVVLPKLDHRYFVYILGRGVPPPSNTFRWCTPRLKIYAMEAALEEVRQQTGEKLLMLTGVRLGESAARDRRITMSCSKDGGECGQGWYQQSKADAIADTLAPLLHWRVCHIWDWLIMAEIEHDFPTMTIAEIYGHNPDANGDTEPLSARTGCIGCPLVQRDRALEHLIQQTQWAYLAPLRKLRELYVEIRKPEYRLRKHGERNKNGDFSCSPSRMGPIRIEKRTGILDQILAIQAEVNIGAADGQPQITLINDEELARIHELIAANTYPNKWDGTEPAAELLLPDYDRNGNIQLVLPIGNDL